jgi:hypothetical protein
MASHDGVKRRIYGIGGALDQIVAILRAAPDTTTALYAAGAASMLAAYPPARVVLLAAGAHVAAASTAIRFASHGGVVRSCTVCQAAVTWVP